MKSFPVKILDDMDPIFAYIREEMTEDHPLEVVVKNLKESLIEKQRGYYWAVVVKKTSDHNSLTMEEQHLEFKEKFLLNIFLGDPDNHPGFSELAENMRVVRDLAPDQYPSIRQFVIDNISHLHATRNNMADLLKECLNYAWDRKIHIPEPEYKNVLDKAKEKK